MKRNNPYIAGPPIVDEKHFFGRDDLIQKLMQDLRNPKQKSFLLFGPRCIGKTSLLKQLEYQLCDDGYTQIYFDLNGKSRLYLNELLYEIAQAMADACAFQPPRQEDFDQEGHYFLQVFLPQIEKVSLQSKVVLLLDEFDFSAKTKPGQAGSEFLPFLAKHFQRLQKIKIVYCLGSNGIHLALKSKFDVFISIPRLSKGDMAALVRQSEADGTLLWDETTIERVWNLTHGHPYLSQMICNIAWTRARNVKSSNTPTIMPDDIGAICEIALPYMKNLFQSVWRGLQPREQKILGIIFKNGNRTFDGQKLYELLRKNRIQIKSNDISAILTRLVTLDIIEIVDAGEKLFGTATPLFSMWVARPKTAVRSVKKAPNTGEHKQNTESTNPLKSAVEKASEMEQKDNWDAAIKIYEPLLEKFPENKEIRAKLHHARNQERLANRYNRALNAISCGDYEDAQKLLAEVILRDPAYKEAPRFLLLATTGIDAKEVKQKLDHDNKELAHAKSQIVRLQGEIAKTNPVNNHQNQELQQRKSTAHTKSEKKPATAGNGLVARKKHKPHDATLNDTLATLDELLDEPIETQAAEKENAFVQTRAEQKHESAIPVEKHEAETDLSDTERQNETAAFTDTAMIEAGQVEKLPDQQQKSWESPEKHKPRQQAAHHLSGSKMSGPIDENGSAKTLLEEQDNLVTENLPPQNIETHFQPNHLRTRSDFRKKVLAKENTLKEQKRKKAQASWIAGTLTCLPVFIWVLWLWYVQPLEWGNGGKIFVLIASVPAWLAACRFGVSDKEKHATSFLALSPVVSYCFYAILAFEYLRPGIPSLTSGHYELLIIAGLIYILVITIIAGLAGEVASVVTIGATSGACAGTALFLNDGGAIEATLVLALITAIMLIMKKVDIGSAAGAGVMAGIPAGFLLFAITFRLTAPTFTISFLASLMSLLAYSTAGGLVYAIARVVTKMSIKTPS